MSESECSRDCLIQKKAVLKLAVRKLRVKMPDANCHCPPSLSSSSCSVAESEMFSSGKSSFSPRLRSHSSPGTTVKSTSRLPFEVSPSWSADANVGYSSVLSNSVSDICTGTTNSKSVEELREEIATLESEIVQLERHLLSLYRTAFEEQLPSATIVSSIHSPYDIESPSVAASTPSFYNSEPHIQKGGFIHHDRSRTSPNVRRHLKYETETSPQTKADQSQCRSLPHGERGAFIHLDQSSSQQVGTSSDTPRCINSLRSLSIKDQKDLDSGRRSLADHLGASCLLNNVDTPDKLSENIVRCISSIYSRLANPSQSNLGVTSSPTSSLSSSSIFSSQNPCDTWTLPFNEDLVVDKQDSSKEDNRRTHVTMTEVQMICLDDDSFKYATMMLKNFRSLVKNLEKVDPVKMKREEKLVFWINIYNALVMHAYLAYGTDDRVRRTSVLKAAYNVGGYSVNACTIQSSILGIRLHTSEPWLQMLFSPGRKLKNGNTRHVYALDYPEPLVHFALCSGSYSDPMLRVYTAKNIFHELKFAKEEFIQTRVYINKDERILLPKLLVHFAKDMSMDTTGVLEVINECAAEAQKRAMKKCSKKKLEKCISWLPQSSLFRYVIHEELYKVRM